MRHLPLSNGGHAQVDDQDFMFCLSMMPWCTDSKGYVKSTCKTNDGYKTYRLHKLIAQRMGISGQIDHKDRNKSNCQRNNLRVCTNHENGANCSLSKLNSTGVRGISLTKESRFMVRIVVLGQRFYLGTYTNLDDAIRVRRDAEVKYYGEFAPNWDV